MLDTAHRRTRSSRQTERVSTVANIVEEADDQNISAGEIDNLNLVVAANTGFEPLRNSTEIPAIRMGGRSFAARSQYHGGNMSNYFGNSKGSRATMDPPINISGNKLPGQVAIFRMEEQKSLRVNDEEEQYRPADSGLVAPQLSLPYGCASQGMLPTYKSENKVFQERGGSL